jgi:ATP-dependent RNA helicase DeaD
VATDVAARGLDLPDLGLVIHADLPVNRQALLHRSGRTGRAGRKGVSVLLVPYTRRRRAEQLLASAHVEAAWSGPPSAEAIRAGDQERLLDDAILTDPPAEEDLTLARLVMDRVGSEAIAAALIRLHRSRLPAPEDLYDPGEPRGGGREERGPREPRRRRDDEASGADTVWFRMAVGRNSNADPKWLVPMICRRGHVTKKDIGAIRIFDRETKFEISRDAVDRFSAAIKSAPEEPIRIEPAGAPGPRRETRGEREETSDARPAKPRKPKPNKNRSNAARR